MDCKKDEDESGQSWETLWGNQEEELKRIAEELHHSVGQSLYSVLLLVKMIKQKNEAATLKEYLTIMETVVKDTLENVILLAKEIRPMLLDDLGVIPAIRSYIQWEQQRSGKEIAFHTVVSSKRFEPDVEIMLFRICQEVLSKVLKGSDSKRIEVILSEDRGVALLVKNESPEVHPDLSHGLLDLKKRAEAKGGKVVINSSAEEGTCIRVWIPIGSKDVQR